VTISAFPVLPVVSAKYNQDHRSTPAMAVPFFHLTLSFNKLGLISLFHSEMPPSSSNSMNIFILTLNKIYKQYTINQEAVELRIFLTTYQL
jgi:hypothetical protein